MSYLDNDDKEALILHEIKWLESQKEDIESELKALNTELIFLRTYKKVKNETN